MLKRFSFALVLIAALALAFAGTAYANFGPHGGYVDDTDSCAGCHRAHSSFSTVGWTDALGTQHVSALLVGSATSMTEFCNACHGNLAPGASTNVVSGVFDSGPSNGEASAPPALSSALGGAIDGGAQVVTAYETSSTFGAPLNGGGFAQMPNPYVWETTTTLTYKQTTSAHNMEAGVQPLWGAGNALATYPNLTCADCHDPHGSSNYRLLKGRVNGATVGGYQADGLTPNAFVFSGEANYPAPGVDPSNTVGGFLKHEEGALQMGTYRPDYTGGTNLLNVTAASPGKSLSVWCSACHSGYAQQSAAATSDSNYGIYEVNPVSGVAVGTRSRHRHPVDQTLAAGYGAGRALQEQVASDPFWVPLEKNGSGSSAFYQDYIGCLTCHRAHGSSSDMTGWAAAHLETNTAGTWVPVRDGVPGVNPAKQVAGGSAAVGSSALLRADNRGVCERCHNK